jgi:hypothetical protein
MGNAPEAERVQVTGIHVNLVDRSITLEANDQTIGRLSLTPMGLIFEAKPPPLPPAPLTSPVDEAADSLSASSEEREPTVVLSGKLKSKPKEGRPDSRGNPTAWARLAVHDEGVDGAHLFGATFHRHTARIALGLSRDASLTVEAYVHANDEANRLDTLSVINILDYPGKASRPER